MSRGNLVIGILLSFLCVSPIRAQVVVNCSIQVTQAGDTNRVFVRWQATPPNRYDILVKSDLNLPWQVLNASPLRALSPAMSYEDRNKLSHRFYRVINRDIDSNMVWIPSGTFLMGSPVTEAERWNDESRHSVTLSRGFWIGRYEVTQAEYLALQGVNPSYFNGGQYGVDLQRPVEQVSWNDVVDYASNLTQRELTAGRLPDGFVYRLPTESEWEYACRAGTTTAFHYGPDLRSGMANFGAKYEYDAVLGSIENPNGIHLGRTVAVGQYDPNAHGLYDMHGNLWEWCHDFYGPYPVGSVTDPVGPATGEFRILRGGGYDYAGWYCRAAHRGQASSNRRSFIQGFRVVLARPLP